MTLDYLDCIGIDICIGTFKTNRKIRIEATEYFTLLRMSHVINHKSIEAVDYA